MLTFIYKTGLKNDIDGRRFKPARKSREKADAELYPNTENEVNNFYSDHSEDACRVCGCDVEGRRLMEDIIIKEIQDSDIDICTEVIRRSFSTVAEEFGLTKENCPTNGAFSKSERLIAEKRRGNMMFALCCSDQIIGFVALDSKNNGVYELEKLAIIPQYRHLGYGKALLDFAKNKVISLGGIKITIGIIEENSRLKEWYSKYGFESTGTRTIPHLPFDVGFMEFNIDP